jgi:hypothetical protein
VRKQGYLAVLTVLILCSQIFGFTPPALPLFSGWNINNSKFGVKNQFIFSASSFGNSILSQGSFLQSLSYRISNPLMLTVSYSLNKSLGGPLKIQGNSPIQPLYSASLDYMIDKYSRLQVSVGNDCRLLMDTFSQPNLFFSDSPFSWQQQTLNHQAGLYDTTPKILVHYERSFLDGLINCSFTYGDTIPFR